MSESETQAKPATPPFDQWAVVELLGHYRMAGRLTEEKHFGVKLGRLDIPTMKTCPECRAGNRPDCPTCSGDAIVDVVTTVYFGGSSVCRVTPVSEHAARAVAVHCAPPAADWGVPDSAFEPPPDSADLIF